MHHNAKPVRKCVGCGLNLRDKCGVFADPHAMWHGRRVCPGFGNEKMLAEYEASRAAQPADARKEKRRQTAEARRAERHHNGDQHVLMTVRK
jgi:hypothetical protein